MLLLLCFARAAPSPLTALTSRISFACGVKTGSDLAPSTASMHLPLPTIPMQKPYVFVVHGMFSHLQVMASLRSLSPSTHTASFHHPSLHLFTYTAVCQASLSYLVALVTAHCQGCRDLCGPLLGKCFAPIPTCRPASMGVLRFWFTALQRRIDYFVGIRRYVFPYYTAAYDMYHQI